MRISGVPVGKVKTITPDKVRRAARTSRSSCARATRRCRRTRGRSCARRRCWARPTSSSRRAATRRSRSPRAASCRPRRCPTRSSSTRSCAPSTPRRAPRSRTGCRRRRRRSPAAGAISTTRSATSAPFAEDTADIVSILNQQEGAVSRLIANTGIVFGALSERDGQLRSLVENSNTVFATTAARDAELQAAFRALPTFEKESELTFERLDEFAARDRPADHAAAAGGARALADARGPRGHLARPAQLPRAAAAADRRVGEGLPGGREDARGPAAARSPSSTRRPPSSRPRSTSSASTSAS